MKKNKMESSFEPRDRSIVDEYRIKAKAEKTPMIDIHGIYDDEGIP